MQIAWSEVWWVEILEEVIFLNTSFKEFKGVFTLLLMIACNDKMSFYYFWMKRERSYS